MSANQAKSASTTFEEVVQHYNRYLAGRKYKKVIQYLRIVGILSADIERFAFFMIRDGVKDDKNNLFIEFHVENKKSGNTPIHTAIKQREYWANIKIFDKEIRHYPKRWDEGHIFIKCSYSDSVEKICAYISEFIYQVKSRIESII